ncbi:MAG: hypothetical protein KF760_17500 [Candidatus Eremiobacteraeota bacterium]|nr:hypothetical protein [Candidatus Eremiobacteraeota bacterium]MCW5870764.1 hypothetical protein [Candidatus Eremiobacteraeota bacterium]
MRGLCISVLLLGLVLTGSANQVNKRIRFAKGASSGTVTGNWHPDPQANETFDRYVLGASKGQRVTVTFRGSAAGSVYCWQSDYENGELASGSGKDASCSFKLPANGDFYVDVGPDEKGKAFDYTVTVAIH